MMRATNKLLLTLFFFKWHVGSVTFPLTKPAWLHITYKRFVCGLLPFCLSPSWDRRHGKRGRHKTHIRVCV